jgi:hypothetical protein
MVSGRPAPAQRNSRQHGSMGIVAWEIDLSTRGVVAAAFRFRWAC